MYAMSVPVFTTFSIDLSCYSMGFRSKLIEYFAFTYAMSVPVVYNVQYQFFIIDHGVQGPNFDFMERCPAYVICLETR